MSYLAAFFGTCAVCNERLVAVIDISTQNRRSRSGCGSGCGSSVVVVIMSISAVVVTFSSEGSCLYLRHSLLSLILNIRSYMYKIGIGCTRAESRSCRWSKHSACDQLPFVIIEYPSFCTSVHFLFFTLSLYYYLHISSSIICHILQYYLQRG